MELNVGPTVGSSSTERSHAIEQLQGWWLQQGLLLRDEQTQGVRLEGTPHMQVSANEPRPT